MIGRLLCWLRFHRFILDVTQSGRSYIYNGYCLCERCGKRERTDRC